MPSDGDTKLHAKLHTGPPGAGGTTVTKKHDADAQYSMVVPSKTELQLLALYCSDPLVCRTALFAAVAALDLAILEQMLKHHCTVHITSVGGKTLIHNLILHYTPEREEPSVAVRPCRLTSRVCILAVCGCYTRHTPHATVVFRTCFPLCPYCSAAH